MNAERLLAFYDRVADAPDAIDRLRRFVLDLAMRGRLVEQNPADEPASELLKRIAAEKARRANAGRTRRKKAVHPQMAPPPFDLPRTWCWASLGAVFQYDAGTKCDPKALDTSAWLLELRDIEKGTGRLLNRVQTSERESRSTKSRFLPGDVLYGKLRPYLNKVIVASEAGYSTTEIVAIRPYLPLSSEYCALALRRPDFVDYVTRLGQGTKMPRLRTNDAVVAPFPLPPLAEQRRIVAKVDQLMALCDRIEETRAAREDTRDRLAKASLTRMTAPDAGPREFRAHARFALSALPALTARTDQVTHLRQTILNLAVRGKLVQQDPADEPVPCADRAIDSDMEPPFPVPPNWRWSRLRALGTLKGGGTPSKARVDFWGGSIPWISPKEMKRDYIEGAQMQITETAIAGSAVNLIEPGSVLFVVRGMILAHSFPVAISRVPLTINQDMKAITLKSPGMAEYLLRALKALKPEMLARVQRSSHGTCRIAGADYRDFMVPLPPLAEQRRIIAKVDELMTLGEQLEAGLGAADGTRSRLLDSLLHRSLAQDAFQCPQDASLGL